MMSGGNVIVKPGFKRMGRAWRSVSQRLLLTSFASIGVVVVLYGRVVVRDRSRCADDSPVCGRTRTVPTCDGSRKGSGVMPLSFEGKEPVTSAICNGGLIDNPPYRSDQGQVSPVSDSASSGSLTHSCVSTVTCSRPRP